MKVVKYQHEHVSVAELVVAESVVVIKKLLQMQPEQHSDIIKHMAKLTDNIQVRGRRPLILTLTP